MKTLLVTAVGAGPAYAGISSGIALPSFESDRPSPPTILENGSQQLRISPTGSPLAFQNFLRVGDEWKPATLANNPFIVGPDGKNAKTIASEKGSGQWVITIGQIDWR